jgi:hypothetical protein
MQKESMMFVGNSLCNPFGCDGKWQTPTFKLLTPERRLSVIGSSLQATFYRAWLH